MEYLTNSHGLFVVNIAGYNSNLALYISARVNVNTNEAKLSYSVGLWNDKLKRLNKDYTNVNDALDYYNRLNNKYGLNRMREMIVKDNRLTSQDITI